MIKFVCVSCGERLSVPRQGPGRDIVCPVCGGINPTPGRKTEGQISAPAAIVKPAEKPVPIAPAVGAQKLEKVAVKKPVAEPSSRAIPPDGKPASKPFSPPPVEPILMAGYSEPNPLPEPERVQVRGPSREWNLPAPVKMGLLILAVMAIVCGIYFGLMLVLRLAIPEQ